MLYAYAPDTGEIIDYVIGNRSRKTVEKLYQKIQHLDIKEICTDYWKSFQEVFPSNKHSIGKKHTQAIEGVNTSLRARNRRFVRKTTCFSKKSENHEAAIKLMIAARNKNHTS